MAGADAAAELVECGERLDLTRRADGWRRPDPVTGLPEVHPVDAKRLIRLPDLPLLCALAFEVLAERPDLVDEGVRGRRPREEAAHPSHAVRSRLLLDQLLPEKELSELLQGRFMLSHDGLRWAEEHRTCHGDVGGCN